MTAATAAMASSTSIPAAPTTTRCHLFLSAQALEASTYGRGVKTRNMTPMTWTSPPEPLAFPNFLHANAWPNSWKIFTITKLAYSSGRRWGDRMFEAWSTRAPVLSAMNEMPVASRPIHSTRPHHEKTAPKRGTNRSRNRSGSRSGMRMNRRFVR